VSPFIHAFTEDRRSEVTDMSLNFDKTTATDMVEAVETEQARPNGFEDDIHWWKQPGLRRLYLLMPFLFLGSTTLGFDGSL
jgi:hypothetical protein